MYRCRGRWWLPAMHAVGPVIVITLVPNLKRSSTVVDLLLSMLNEDVLPRVPRKGSLGYLLLSLE